MRLDERILHQVERRVVVETEPAPVAVERVLVQPHQRGEVHLERGRHETTRTAMCPPMPSSCRPGTDVGHEPGPVLGDEGVVVHPRRELRRVGPARPLALHRHRLPSGEVAGDGRRAFRAPRGERDDRASVAGARGHRRGKRAAAAEPEAETTPYRCPAGGEVERIEGVAAGAELQARAPVRRPRRRPPTTPSGRARSRLRPSVPASPRAEAGPARTAACRRCRRVWCCHRATRGSRPAAPLPARAPATAARRRSGARAPGPRRPAGSVARPRRRGPRGGTAGEPAKAPAISLAAHALSRRIRAERRGRLRRKGQRPRRAPARRAPSRAPAG